MKITYKIFATIFVALSFVGVILDSSAAIPAGLAAVTYAILSLKE